MVDVGNFHWIIQWGCFSCQAWINKRRLRLLNWKDIKSLLVGGAITILKNMSSSMERIIPYMKWKITFMFETTNQYTIKYNLQILLTIQ